MYGWMTEDMDVNYGAILMAKHLKIRGGRFLIYCCALLPGPSSCAFNLRDQAIGFP
jgi:hypothetical protein